MNMLKSAVVGLGLFVCGIANAQSFPADNVLQIYSSFGDIRSGDKAYHFKDMIITNVSDELTITNIVFVGAECKGKFATPAVLERGAVAVYRIYNDCNYTGFVVQTDKGNFTFGTVN